jgi:hypothetical protein
MEGQLTYTPSTCCVYAAKDKLAHGVAQALSMERAVQCSALHTRLPFGGGYATSKFG